jgi:pyridoxine/pyridoxamine 5'-phosphate oxidase
LIRDHLSNTFLIYWIGYAIAEPSIMECWREANVRLHRSWFFFLDEQKQGYPTDGEGERRHECGLGWDDITIKARFRGIVDTLSSYEELKFHQERLSRWNLGWFSRDERESYCLIPFVPWFDFVFHLHIFLLGV